MKLPVLRAWSPWSPAETIRWLIVGLAGHVTCLVAWWLASREEAFDDQVRWTTLAVAGFVVVAFADVTWLLRARFVVLQRREAILPTDVPGIDAEMPVAHGSLVGGQGLDLFHLSTCPLAAGKGWPTLSRDQVHDRAPCGVCNP